MMIYRGLLASFVVECTAAGVLLGQSHPSAPSGHQRLCVGTGLLPGKPEVTLCRVPLGSRPVTRGPDIAAKVAAADGADPGEPSRRERVGPPCLGLPDAAHRPMRSHRSRTSRLRSSTWSRRCSSTQQFLRPPHDYGNAAYLLGYQDFAIYEFDRALAINSRSARTWMGRGWSWYEECKLDRASSDFDRAVSLDRTLASSIAGPAEIDSRRTECARIAWQLAHPPPPPPPQEGSTNIIGQDLGAAGGRPAGGRGSGERRQRVGADHQGAGRHPVTRAFSPRCHAELRRRM